MKHFISIMYSHINRCYKSSKYLSKSSGQGMKEYVLGFSSMVRLKLVKKSAQVIRVFET